MAEDERARPPIGLLGMIPLVAIVECAIALGHDLFTHAYTNDWRIAGKELAHQPRPGESVVFLGDSTLKFGLLPNVFEEYGGGDSINLSVCGGQIPTSYYLLKRAIDSGHPPRTIVIGSLPHLMKSGVSYNRRQWNELLEPLELAELALGSKSAELALDLLLRRAFPSINCRDELRVACRRYAAGDREIQALLLACSRNWRTNKGAWARQERRFDPARLNAREWRAFAPENWACRRENEAYLNRLLALAESRHIRAYWLIVPTTSYIQDLRRSAGVERRYDAFLERLQADHPALKVIDGRGSGYPQSAFLDPVHLGIRGSIALSADLAETLRSDAQGRIAETWIALPPFREIGTKAHVEDFDQSLAILGYPPARDREAETPQVASARHPE